MRLLLDGWTLLSDGARATPARLDSLDLVCGSIRGVKLLLVASQAGRELLLLLNDLKLSLNLLLHQLGRRLLAACWWRLELLVQLLLDKREDEPNCLVAKVRSISQMNSNEKKTFRVKSCRICHRPCAG